MRPRHRLLTATGGFRSEGGVWRFRTIGGVPADGTPRDLPADLPAARAIRRPAPSTGLRAACTLPPPMPRAGTSSFSVAWVSFEIVPARAPLQLLPSGCGVSLASRCSANALVLAGHRLPSGREILVSTMPHPCPLIHLFVPQPLSSPDRAPMKGKSRFGHQAPGPRRVRSRRRRGTPLSGAGGGLTLIARRAVHSGAHQTDGGPMRRLFALVLTLCRVRPRPGPGRARATSRLRRVTAVGIAGGDLRSLATIEARRLAGSLLRALRGEGAQASASESESGLSRD